MSAHSKPTSLGKVPPPWALVLLASSLAACAGSGVPDAAFEPLDLTIQELAGGPYEVAQTFTPLATGRLLQLDLWVKDTTGSGGAASPWCRSGHRGPDAQGVAPGPGNVG